MQAKEAIIAVLKDVLLDDYNVDDQFSNGSKASRPRQEGHRLAVIFHCISLVIHASFYTLLEQISMHHRSTYLYIIGAHFYVLIRFSCSLAPEDGVAANEELTMQASTVSYAFFCLSTCLLLRDDFYVIA